MVIGKYEVHELADFFPILEGEQYEQLYDDIKEHGLQEPVVLYHRKILDGRNRALIAEKLEIELKTVDFESLGTQQSPAQYVISANLHRRHLSDQERSKIALKLVKAIKQEQDAEKSAAKEEHDLCQPNSGNMFPLSGPSSSDIPLPPAWVKGRGKKGPAAIAAAQTGLSKRAVNKAIARDKDNSDAMEVFKQLSPELRDRVYFKNTKRDGSPKGPRGFARAVKEVVAEAAAAKSESTAGAAQPKHESKVRLPAHGGSEPMDPERAVSRIGYLASQKLDLENSRAVKEALETDAWKLTPQFLIGLATLKDSQILKMIDCLRFEDLRFESAQ